MFQQPGVTRSQVRGDGFSSSVRLPGGSARSVGPDQVSTAPLRAHRCSEAPAFGLAVAEGRKMSWRWLICSRIQALFVSSL